MKKLTRQQRQQQCQSQVQMRGQKKMSFSAQSGGQYWPLELIIAVIDCTNRSAAGEPGKASASARQPASQLTGHRAAAERLLKLVCSSSLHLRLLLLAPVAHLVAPLQTRSNQLASQPANLN